jgi:hypothetical protein
MTTKATITCSMDVTETIAAASSPASSADGSSNARRYSEYNQTNKILDGSTTPKADTVVDLSRTLAAASETADLTAAPLASDINETVDLTGKKLVGLLIYADAGNNAAGVTIESGASNGYDFLGDAAYGLTVYPGMTIEMFQLGVAASLDAVGASDKTLDFGGTAGDELQILALFGTQS